MRRSFSTLGPRTRRAWNPGELKISPAWPIQRSRLLGVDTTEVKLTPERDNPWVKARALVTRESAFRPVDGVPVKPGRNQPVICKPATLNRSVTVGGPLVSLPGIVFIQC
jgi:hypothetical protein